MGIKKRTYNTRHIKASYPYKIEEIAAIHNCHKNTVRGWIRNGLPIIDNQKPYLIYGSDLIFFIKQKQIRRKTKCQDHELYCLGCKAARTPWCNHIDIHIKNKKQINLAAFCSVCKKRMNKAGSFQKLSYYIEKFDVQTVRGRHLLDRDTPPLNSNLNKEHKND